MSKGFGQQKNIKKKQKFQKTYQNLVIKALELTSENRANLQLLYPFIRKNLTKIDDEFNFTFYNFLKKELLRNSKELSQAIAINIYLFCNTLKNSPFAQSNPYILEVVISGYKIAYQTFEEEKEIKFTRIASIQSHLGVAFAKRILGNENENWELAIGCYEKALKLNNKQNPTKEDIKQWAEINQNLSIAYANKKLGNKLENLEKAIDYSNLALTVYNKIEHSEEWAAINNNLGVCYRTRIAGDQKDNLNLAIKYFKLALEIYTFDRFQEDWAMINQNLGNTYRDLKDIQKAIEHYKLALKVYTFKNFPLTYADINNNLGNIYCKLEKENIQIAIDYYKQALNIYDISNCSQKSAMVNMNLGFVYNFVEPIKALEFYENASQIYTEQNYPQEWAILQSKLGITYIQLNNFSASQKSFQLALKIFTPITNPKQCLINAKLLGNLYYENNQFDKAINSYSLAIEAIEITRSWAKTDQRRQEILAESLDVYENMVQACINAGELEKAIETVERSRSKLLVDLMASKDLYRDENIPPEVESLLQKYQELQQQIDLEQSLINNNSNQKQKLDRASFNLYNETIEKLNQEKQEIWQEIRKLDPVLAGEIKVDHLSFSQMQKLIKSPDTAILSFYTTKTDTHIFIIKQPSPLSPLPQGEGYNGINLYTCEGEGLDNLQNWLSENWLKSYINNYPNWLDNINQILTKLSQKLRLNQLIEQHLNNIQELIIIPHLTLHLIPFSALPIAEGEYLGDRFLIRYTPSTQILQFCDDRKPIETNLNYGTVEDATNDLPCASFEGNQIANLYNIPAQFRLQGKEKATCENYRELMKKVNIIHSCHHAEFNLNDPLNSALKLGDGNITLGQLMSPSWRFDKTLSDVFLSCCETGLGTPEITDDILTLSAGFLCAGARSVISTLWAVDDLATALFSLFYYQYCQEEKSRPEALKLAQIKLRNLTNQEIKNSAYLGKLKLDLQQKKELYFNQYYEIGDDDPKFKELENKIEKCEARIKQIDLILQSSHEYPFSHPSYWAGFICHGLQ